MVLKPDMNSRKGRKLQKETRKNESDGRKKKVGVTT